VTDVPCRFLSITPFTILLSTRPEVNQDPCSALTFTTMCGCCTMRPRSETRWVSVCGPSVSLPRRSSSVVQSHAGKVVERSWYQRSKHIFPASRWEVYDPDKDYGAYVSSLGKCLFDHYANAILQTENRLDTSLITVHTVSPRDHANHIQKVFSLSIKYHYEVMHSL